MIFLKSAIVIATYGALWFIISIFKKRNDIADIAWGLGYMVLCAFYLFYYEPSTRAYLLVTLISIWGIRLAIFIMSRNMGKSEDFRYKKWREDWGRTFYLRSFLQVYMLQGFFLLLIITPIMVVVSNPQGPFTTLDYLGVIVWLFGFYFEAVGDYQLAQFKKNPDNKGKIMQTGLWRYTRHPNYFGEVAMWWGIFLIALNSPHGLYALIGPLTITFLLLFVSGVPMLEEKYEANAEFENYKEKTSKFFPLPPKGSKAKGE
jgi:steroid 5-alpha reductase family enzyme